MAIYNGDDFYLIFKKHTMEYLKLEKDLPVRVTLIEPNPRIGRNNKGQDQLEYAVTVNGKTMTYIATDKAHEKIQEFIKLNGMEFALIKKAHPSNATWTYISVEPFDITNSSQNSSMYGKTRTEYIKTAPVNSTPQSGPDWDKIKEDKNDDILKGQCRNQAIELMKGKKFSQIECVGLARDLYYMWKDMDWGEVVESKIDSHSAETQEDLTDLPF